MFVKQAKNRLLFCLLLFLSIVLAHLSQGLRGFRCLCRLSTFFLLFHQNRRANFNQTWRKAFLGDGDSSLLKLRVTHSFKMRYCIHDYFRPVFFLAFLQVQTGFLRLEFVKTMKSMIDTFSN